MLKHIKQSNYLKHSVWSFGGQLSFLLANFLLFILLVNKITQDQFGTWALYITIISIGDSIRQGMVQNGLARLIIQFPNDDKLPATGFALNYMIVLILGALILITTQFYSFGDNIAAILPHAGKSLLVIGTIQFISTLCQARLDFKTYFITNLIYLFCFITCLVYLNQVSETISLIQIINAQLISLVLPVIYFLSTTKISIILPSRKHLKALLDFGKYSTGTNFLSILFHKADILMIAYFLDPVSVALFHFASKIMNYAELPLHALSQVIYPRLSASHQHKDSNELNKEYGLSIIRLLVLVIPIALVVIMFNNSIINLLSSGEYTNSSQLIILLGIGIIFKPWGRVFGLTLDAIGKPKVNFRMLLLSLLINITMNLILIPIYGVQGAAIATTSSILVTTIIGQIRIESYASIKPIHDVWMAAKFQILNIKALTWN